MKAICDVGALLGLFRCETENQYLLRQQFNNHMAEWGLSYGTEAEYIYRME